MMCDRTRHPITAARPLRSHPPMTKEAVPECDWVTVTESQSPSHLLSHQPQDTKQPCEPASGLYLTDYKPVYSAGHIACLRIPPIFVDQTEPHAPYTGSLPPEFFLRKAGRPRCGGAAARRTPSP